MNNKILHYLPYWGVTTETFIRQLLDDLNSIGYENVVTCKKSFINSDNVLELSNYNIKFERVLNSLSYRLPIRKYIFSRTKINELKKFNCEVLHAHFGEGGWDSSLIFTKKNFNPCLPIVISLHGTDTTKLPLRNKNYKNALSNLGSKKGVLFTVPSNFLKQEAIKKLGLAPEKIFVVGNTFKTVFFTDKPKKNSSTTCFLNVARFVDWKNQKQIICAFKNVIDSNMDAHLVLVGDGPTRIECERLVKNLDLEGKVSFLGAIKHSELKEIMFEADVYIQASKQNSGGEAESFGVVILEALAANCKVIVANTGGMPEVVSYFQSINSGVCVYESSSDRSLSEKMKKYLNVEGILLDKELRKRTLIQFSNENVVNTYVDVYKRAYKDFYGI